MGTDAPGRTERLQLRATQQQKTMLSRAATAVDEDLTTFVLTAAAARAEDLLGSPDVLDLPPVAVEAILDALDRPAEPNAALLEALRRPRRFAWA